MEFYGSKRSGKWLAHAMQEEMFVPLELAEVKRSIQDEKEIASSYVLNGELRPSIETAMHAVLPHRVVIHVHSINAISWAIRLDGPEQLKERLAGLHWKWIPYAASGIALAREIEKAVASAAEADVLILGNHGLVVCGQDCHTAEALLCEVERRLAITPRRFPKPDTTVLTMIARFSRWQFPDVDCCMRLAPTQCPGRFLKAAFSIHARPFSSVRPCLYCHLQLPFRKLQSAGTAKTELRHLSLWNEAG
jgi:hypothetical protein